MVRQFAYSRAMPRENAPRAARRVRVPNLFWTRGNPGLCSCLISLWPEKRRNSIQVQRSEGQINNPHIAIIPRFPITPKPYSCFAISLPDGLQNRNKSLASWGINREMITVISYFHAIPTLPTLFAPPLPQIRYSFDHEKKSDLGYDLFVAGCPWVAGPMSAGFDTILGVRSGNGYFATSSRC